MLQRSKIEGYDELESNEMLDDTPPAGVLTRFFVKSEEMPALSAQANRIVRKNFVYVRREMDLGRSCYERRIRDKVEFDEATEKWKVKMLAKGDRSDIKKNTDEWNAFVRNASENDIGTPLSLFFKNDPSRVEWYGFYHIRTVERLAATNDQDVQNLGNGVKEDRARAQHYLAETKSEGAAMALKRDLDNRDQQVATLQNQVADLTEKLTELLKAQLSAQDDDDKPIKRGPGRPRAIQKEITG